MKVRELIGNLLSESDLESEVQIVLRSDTGVLLEATIEHDGESLVIMVEDDTVARAE